MHVVSKKHKIGRFCSFRKIGRCVGRINKNKIYGKFGEHHESECVADDMLADIKISLA